MARQDTLRIAWIPLVASLGLVNLDCLAHEVGGKSSVDVFSDRNVRAMVDYACAGDVPGVKGAIARGANPDYPGLDGTTPLMWVVSCRNADGVRAILDGGADPDLGTGGRFQPVLIAATQDDPAVLELLLDRGANPNFHDGKYTETPLYKAFATGMARNQWGSYYTLLERGADIEFEDQVGETIVHYAIAMGRFDKVVELLHRGYSRNLAEVRKRIEIRQVSPEFREQHAWKQEALGLLTDRIGRASD